MYKETPEFYYTVKKEDNGILVQIYLKDTFDFSKGDIKIDFIDPRSEDGNILTLYSTIMRASIAMEGYGSFWAKFIPCKECSALIKKVKIIISRIQIVETSDVGIENEPKPKKKDRRLKLVTGFGTGPWGGKSNTH